MAAPVVQDAPPAASVNRKSIAVLAFANLDPGKDQGVFSDGMSKEFLNALAQVRALKVPPVSGPTC